MSQLVTLNIAAGATNLQVTAAKFLSVKQCSLPCSIVFNGGQTETISAGQVYDKSAMNKGEGFNYFSITNPNAIAVTVSFQAGGAPVNYQPADSSESNASTYAFGNIGVAVSQAAGGAFTGSPACDGNGFLQITNAMQLLVSNTNNGHRRQSIVFCMSAMSPAALNVLDANGFAFMTILAGQIIELTTDSVLTLSGAGGTAACTIGQIFLTNS